LVSNIIGSSSHSKKVKSLINNVEVVDDHVMAEELNSYFANIATDLDSEIPPTQLCPSDNISVN
jgi:hypothetical protein